jgi:hypothetical protein
MQNDRQHWRIYLGQSTQVYGNDQNFVFVGHAGKS